MWLVWSVILAQSLPLTGAPPIGPNSPLINACRSAGVQREHGWFDTEVDTGLCPFVFTCQRLPTTRPWVSKPAGAQPSRCGEQRSGRDVGEFRTAPQMGPPGTA